MANFPISHIKSVTTEDINKLISQVNWALMQRAAPLANTGGKVTPFGATPAAIPDLTAPGRAEVLDGNGSTAGGAKSKSSTPTPDLGNPFALPEYLPIDTPVGSTTFAALTDVADGTWTPADASGASLAITHADSATRYQRMGSLVILSFSITYPVTADASNAAIDGFPYDWGDVGSMPSAGYIMGVGAMPIYMGITPTRLYFEGVTNASLSGKTIKGTFHYFI